MVDKLYLNKVTVKEKILSTHSQYLDLEKSMGRSHSDKNQTKPVGQRPSFTLNLLSDLGEKSNLSLFNSPFLHLRNREGENLSSVNDFVWIQEQGVCDLLFKSWLALGLRS